MMPVLQEREPGRNPTFKCRRWCKHQSAAVTEMLNDLSPCKQDKHGLLSCCRCGHDLAGHGERIPVTLKRSLHVGSNWRILAD